MQHFTGIKCLTKVYIAGFRGIPLRAAGLVVVRGHGSQV